VYGEMMHAIWRIADAVRWRMDVPVMGTTQQWCVYGQLMHDNYKPMSV